MPSELLAAIFLGVIAICVIVFTICAHRVSSRRHDQIPVSEHRKAQFGPVIRFPEDVQK